MCKLLLSYDADVDANNLEYLSRPRIFHSNLSILFYCIVFLNFSFCFLSDQNHSLFAILISCSISLGAPLHYAAKIGDVEICKLLLSSKADVNRRRWVLGRTPLHCAVREGNVEVCRALITAKADMTARDECDAMQCRLLRALMMLFATHAPPCRVGITPLDEAISRNYPLIYLYMQARIKK